MNFPMSTAAEHEMLRGMTDAERAAHWAMLANRRKQRRAHRAWVNAKQAARRAARVGIFSVQAREWSQEYNRLHPVPRIEKVHDTYAKTAHIEEDDGQNT